MRGFEDICSKGYFSAKKLSKQSILAKNGQIFVLMAKILPNQNFPGKQSMIFSKKTIRTTFIPKIRKIHSGVWKLYVNKSAQRWSPATNRNTKTFHIIQVLVKFHKSPTNGLKDIASKSLKWQKFSQIKLTLSIFKIQTWFKTKTAKQTST